MDINELIYCDQNSNASSQGHGPKSNGSTGTTSDSAIGSVSQPLTPASMNRFQTQTPENWRSFLKSNASIFNSL